jgi:hypothetical protein
LHRGPSGFAPSLTLGYEIGHNLGLWHNFHGVSEVPYCSQCYEITQCNGDCSYPGCDALGDLCCDTAAASEPEEDGCYPPSGGSECVPPFTSWSQDEATYRNYMNSTKDGCWNRFSSQQAGRMRCWTNDTLGGWIGGQELLSACCRPPPYEDCIVTTLPCCTLRRRFRRGPSAVRTHYLSRVRQPLAARAISTAAPDGDRRLWRKRASPSYAGEPTSVNTGRLISSFGSTPAAYKHVVGVRMKRSGMRWSRKGSQTTLSLRVGWLNGSWDALRAKRPLAA